MRASAVFESSGVRFRIRAPDDRVLAGVRNYLPCGSSQVTSPLEGVVKLLCYTLQQTSDGFYWELRKARTVVLQTRSLLRAMQTLRGRLVEHVGRYTTRHTWVHAGVVGWKGRAIVLPGESFSGKSTLVAKLLQAGATYYSDEVARLDENGLVHPYPRPLELRDGRAAGEPVANCSGSVEGNPQPLPVAMVVFARFSVKGPWQLKQVTPGRAVALSMQYTFCAREAPVQALRAWSRAVEGAGAWSWTRGDAGDAAALLLEGMESLSLTLS